MSDQAKLDVEAELKVRDSATAALKRFWKAADQVAKKVDGLTAGLSRYSGMVGAVFGGIGLVESVRGAHHYLDSIKRIQVLTGQTVQSTVGLAHAMEMGGLRTSEVEQTLTAMARKQSAIRSGNKEAAEQARRLGVDLKQGPEKVLVRMAELVDKNKLGTGEVSKLLESSGPSLVGIMDTLRKGPQEVSRLMEEGRRKNKHLNGETLEGYNRMDESIQRVQVAWRRIATIVLVHVAPAVEKISVAIERRVDGWAEGAAKFGKFLVSHMDTAISLAKVLTKIMAANYALQKLTGEGLVTNMSKLVRGTAGAKGMRRVEGFLGLPRGGRRRGRGAASAAASLAGAGPARFIGRFFRSIAMGARTLFSSVANILRGVVRFIPQLLRLSPIFAAVGLLIAIVVKNARQIWEALQPTLDALRRAWDNVKQIGQTIGRVFSLFGERLMAYFGPGSRLYGVLSWVGRAVLKPFELVASAIESITKGALILATVAKRFLEGKGASWEMARMEVGMDEAQRRRDAPSIKLVSALRAGRGTKEDFDRLAKLYRDRYGEGADAQMAARFGGATSFDAIRKKYGGSSDRPQVQVNQDFRGSRFDITQTFAEGFDPDRIAVGFANDLSALGERRLQSGLAPIFSVR